jgi:hypothetical protein
MYVCTAFQLTIYRTEHASLVRVAVELAIAINVCTAFQLTIYYGTEHASDARIIVWTA